ncbi:MAG TPA: STAS domain-containing protein [Pyrinomonadaceae bacterium]|nr:STAS domain-containing protein [Pyrinomonadaceae bacterium]
MTTRITKSESEQRKTTLKVEGSLHLEEAEVLERTFSTLRAENDREIEIDLSDITFLDSESATVLCRLQALGAELLGLHFFAQRLIEIAAVETTDTGK